MRRVRITGLILTAALSALCGCLDLNRQTRPGESRDRPAVSQSSPLNPAPPDALFIQTVLIEQSIGDAFLDEELWTQSPSAVSPEGKALLAENGLRAAVINGTPPARFVELITSELATVNPQYLTFANRKQEVVPTNGPLEACTFQVLADFQGERHEVSLKQASLGWCVKPEITADGRVKLVCEPQAQHGDRQDWLRASADGTQFTMHGELPRERFPALGFEVTLGPREYLVIGGFANQPDTLGDANFRVEATGKVRQRVLVIRAGKGRETPGDDLSMGPKPRGGPPIAAAAARGRGEK